MCPHSQTYNSPDHNTDSANNTAPYPHRTDTLCTGTVLYPYGIRQASGDTKHLAPTVIGIFYYGISFPVNLGDHVILGVPYIEAVLSCDSQRHQVRPGIAAVSVGLNPGLFPIPEGLPTPL